MKKIFLTVFLVIFSVGCANVPKQSFNKEANKDLKSISLINPPVEKEVTVNIIHHIGNSFGLIGNIAAALDTHAKTTDYNAAIKEYKVEWSDYIQKSLQESLKKNGYQVELVTARKDDDKKKEYLEKYPEVKTDAILDYYFSVGQLATGPTTPYVPSVMLFARMIKAKDKSVIYEDHFLAGNPAVAGQAVQLGASENTYKNVTALDKNAEESVKTLKEMADKITGRIGQDLRK